MKFNDAEIALRGDTASFLFPANAMPFRLTGLAVLFTLMLLIQTLWVTAETSPMPTKTPFDPLPTKTRLPADPPTKTALPVESSATPTGLPAATRTIEHEPLPTAPHARVDHTETPTASPSATPIPTQRRPISTATPLPSATVTLTEPPTPARTQTRPPQLSPSPIFNVISSPNPSPLMLGLVSLIGLIGLALLVQYHRWVRTDLHLRHAALQLSRHAQLIIDDEWIITLLNQVIFNASGQDVGLDTIERILINPPVIVALGRDFQRVIFTPAPTNVRALIPLLDGSPRRLRAHPIDARHGDLFVIDDLAAAYQHLCRQHHITQPLPARLARCDRWLIYLLPPPDSHSQRR